ncbi:hypothetical protein [Cesiribacter andamanensis]|uniref:hypothetical protein n=1 Tax=Cesiribacter andamanensis TaxID=649507 RepID=UPI000345781F|nr:hypothetical protein [Cesiribacter andamanensis]
MHFTVKTGVCSAALAAFLLAAPITDTHAQKRKKRMQMHRQRLPRQRKKTSLSQLPK